MASSMSQTTSCPKAGSKACRLGSSIPMEVVIVDWWAPPSGASVTPDGVPASTKRAPT